MARTQKFEYNIWRNRIHKANEYYLAWETRFKCRILEDYWENFQWRQIIDIPYYKPYSVNLVYAELKKKLANMLYQNLSYVLSPRPGHYSYNPQFAMNSASLKQDFLNEIVARANKDQGFNEQIKLTAMDSYFRFGAMEVGYSADWRNPSKKPPLLANHDESDDQDSRVVEDAEVPENERIFFKRQKASRFRVSVLDDARLENCSWCGYYTYLYKSVLAKTKGLQLPKDFEINEAGYASDYIWGSARIPQDTNRAYSDSKDMVEALRKGKAVKVWKIWDNEDSKFKLILEPNFDIIWEDDFYHLPFATHRHDLRLDGWYPVPPVWQWLNPQDEINQAREQMRNYRRRFTRKFKYWGIDQEELEKFKSELDGEMIKLKNPNSIIDPIANPEIGISIQDALNAGRDDFNIVSGSSTDLSTAQSDRTTATQSKITAAKAAVIESVEQVEFEHFYHKVGRLALLEAQLKFTGGIWVKDNSDPDFGATMDPNKLILARYVTSQDLSDAFDIDIEITCINASPQRMQEELNKYVQFLALVNQYPQIALSPDLIRETAFRTGYRNEKVIAAMQKAALTMMLQQSVQGAQQAGVQNPAGAGNLTNMLRNAIPATTQATDQQLQSQVQ